MPTHAPTAEQSAPAIPRPPARHWRRLLSSPWGVYLTGLAALLLISALQLGFTPDTDSLRQQIRSTARSSLLFFLMAYTASALHRLHPAPFTLWLLQRRRQWGLLFASSHALHAAGIAGLHATASPALWAQLTSLPSWIIGGSGYLVLLLLTLSSCDAMVRRLGAQHWQRLHRWGSHCLCLVFLLSCSKRVAGDPLYLLPLALLLGALVLRAWPGARTRAVVQARSPSVPRPGGAD